MNFRLISQTIDNCFDDKDELLAFMPVFGYYIGKIVT